MKNVLLVKTSSMGDLIHTFPALTDLMNHRSGGYQFTWVVEEAFSDIAQMHPITNNIIQFSFRRWKKNLLSAQTWREYQNFKKELRATRWDKIVDAQGLLKSVAITKTAANRGQSPTYSYSKSSIREPMAARFYDHNFTVAKGLSAIERNRALFAQIFNYEINDAPDFGIQHWEESSDLTPNRPFAALIHGTSAESKEWPEERWIQLGNWLAKEGLISILFWGNAREKARAERMAKNILGAIVMPKVTLQEAGLILSKAELIVAVDTGLAHLANTQDRPIVGLFLDSHADYAGVIPTKGNPHAKNLGGKGKNPEVLEVIEVIRSFNILPQV